MKDWLFSQNTFLNVTSESSVAARNISLFHDHALEAAKGETFFLGIYNTFHPLHLAFMEAYEEMKSQGGLQEGETLNFSQMLVLLSNTKIKQWDVKIQNEYTQNTPEYRKLLPNRRTPFQTGKQNDRVVAVKALSMNIGTDVKLTTVKADVDTFYGQLFSAMKVQKVSKSTTETKNKNLEAARVAMCIGQYANLGALMQEFASSPSNIDQYFDLHTIRSGSQVSYRGTLKSSEIFTIVKHTFGENDQLVLGNAAVAPLKFYLASDKNMQPNSEFIILNKGKQTILASTLGKLTNSYLTVQNTDPNYSGEFFIEIL